MPALLLGTESYSREWGDMPPVVLINMFTEASPTDDDGVILQQRPGLTSAADWGDGPGHGVFSSAGTFGGDRFAVSGLYLYREGTQLGPILGTGPVRWAASDTAVVVTRGTFVYSYNGTDLQSIPFPDGANCIDVAYLSGLFFFVREGGHQFYWNDINEDERTINGLDFASAELMPDDLMGVQAVLGQLILIGQESTETWFPTTDPDLPVQRVDQRLFSAGARAPGCSTQLGDTVLFVGNNGKVYRLGGGMDPISNPGIEERIKASTDCTVFAFTWDGHAFFCVRLDDTTLAFDLSTEKWTEFNTYQHGNWRAKCAANVGTDVYFGDDTDGNIWTFGTAFTDAGDPLEGYFTAMLPIQGGAIVVDSLEARCNTGSTDPLVGQDANPVIEMRYSRTRGRTWADWREAPLGAQGEYRTRAIYRRLGMFDAPGALFQFRVTDVTPRRVGGVYINEPGGGRSR